MKKLLIILGSFTFVISSSTTTIACELTSNPKPQKTTPFEALKKQLEDQLTADGIDFYSTNEAVTHIRIEESVADGVFENNIKAPTGLEQVAFSRAEAKDMNTISIYYFESVASTEDASVFKWAKEEKLIQVRIKIKNFYYAGAENFIKETEILLDADNKKYGDEDEIRSVLGKLLENHEKGIFLSTNTSPTGIGQIVPHLQNITLEGNVFTIVYKLSESFATDNLLLNNFEWKELVSEYVFTVSYNGTVD
ncbi:hypothetical protein SCHIN_v1c07170 [Spiroplasma chinense]|uniref:Lipoprotein n=1 Tax=Spiroplasma chinense TaxID=216932 RepID=A0A5B9Y741_9MOLU|nr:lipoprotein [Spiroplasma chinense]QEH61912.1 hypothetical protein SCHIN_v1c07170 [Spiroplasma chinense]